MPNLLITGGSARALVLELTSVSPFSLHRLNLPLSLSFSIHSSSVNCYKLISIHFRPGASPKNLLSWLDLFFLYYFTGVGFSFVLDQEGSIHPT
jgi:hypothetical protein